MLNKQQPADPQPTIVLVDAAMMVRSISQVSESTSEWVRLLSQAQRYEMILPLRYLLAELQRLFEVELPEWVLPNLQRMAISYHELLTYKLSSESLSLRAKAELVKLRQRWKNLADNNSRE